MGKVRDKKRKKRVSLGGGVARAASDAKTGKTYLNIPVGVKVFREEANATHLLDIIPYIVKNVSRHPEAKYIPEDIWWRFPYKLHRGVGPNNVDILCPGSIGKPCPICEERSSIYDDPEIDDEMAKGLKPSKRCLYVVIPKNAKGFTEEPHVWDVSDYCFREMLDTELNCGEEDWNDFPNLEGGFTLKARFAEEAIGTTKFAMCDRIDFKERDDYDDSILDEAPCLDDILIFLPYDAVNNLFQGLDPDEIETDEEKQEEQEEKTSRKKKTTKKKARPEPKPEPEDEEEPEPASKEKPKRGKKPTRSKKVKDEGCPFGHKFGEEFDEYDDCDDCVQFDNCMKKFEED